MKTNIFKNLTVTAALLVGLVGASSALAVEDLTCGLVAGLSTDRDTKSGDAKGKVCLAELATLTLGDGQNIRFLLDPDTHEIAVQESGSINRDTELPLLMDARLQELDPLEIYLALTPRDRAVPRAIYELSSSSEARASAAARALVESIESMPAQVISYRHQDAKPQAGFMPELCGANGAQEFQVLCNRGSNFPESFCEPGKHIWHQRTSRVRYKQSHGLTVACQAAVLTQHDLRLGGHKHTFDMPVHQRWHITRIFGLVRSRRVVRMDRYSPTSADLNVSYIRSWIGFRD
jgi:hypothetical protein